MNHEEVRDWIDAAFATPGARVADDAVTREVQQHLADCSDCAQYDRAMRLAALKLDLARGPSPEVRANLMAAARRSTTTRRAVAPQPVAPQHRWRRPMVWRFAAAALVLAVVGVAGGAWLAGTGARRDNDADHLSQAVALMTTLAADRQNQEVVLRDAAGSNGGLAVISSASHQMAVFATHLSPGVEYHCYLERGGVRTWVGTMYATPGVEFWAGDMAPAIDMSPGDVLVVAADESQPAVLTAQL
jgi:hypothetical protein